MNPEKRWFLYLYDHHEGPYSDQEVLGLLSAGKISSKTHVWRAGLKDWLIFEDCPELEDLHSVRLSDTNLSSSGQGERATGPLSAQADEPFQGGLASIDEISPSRAVWTLNANGVHYGPVCFAEVIYRVLKGEVSELDYLWREGWTGWKRINQVESFAKNLRLAEREGAASYGIRYNLNIRPLKLGRSSEEEQVPEFDLEKVKPVEMPQMSRVEAMEERVKTLLKSEKAEKINKLISWIRHQSGLGVTALGEASEGGSLNESSRLIDLAVEEAKAKKKRRKFFLLMTLFLAVGLVLVFTSPYLLDRFGPRFEKPSEMNENDYLILSEAARASGAPQVQMAKSNDPDSPTFFIASNLPDGTWLEVTIEGLKRQVIGVKEFQKKLPVEMRKGLGQVKFDTTGRGLPPGKYKITAAIHPEQGPEVRAKLNAMNAFSLISSDIFFVPGHLKEPFQKVLRDYLEKIDREEAGFPQNQAPLSALDTEKNELEQLIGTLEAGWGEIDKAFRDPSLAQKPEEILKVLETWIPIFGKLKSAALKVNPQTASDFKYPVLYQKTSSVIQDLEVSLSDTREALKAKKGSKKLKFSIQVSELDRLKGEVEGLRALFNAEISQTPGKETPPLKESPPHSEK